jgi:hypothetical protein
MSIDDQWNWYYISKRISMKDVINNPNERWDREGLSQNINICMKVINMDLPNAIGKWDWEYISSRISIEDIVNHPNETWSRYFLSFNMNISLEVTRMNLPNATGEWEEYSIDILKGREICHNNITTLPVKIEEDIISIVKENTRSYLSKYYKISMYWIRFKDRVGICKNPKWSKDIDIICID